MTTARIDIVDERTGTVLQTYRGVPITVVATVCAWLNPFLSLLQSAAQVKRQVTGNQGRRKRADR